MREQFSIKEKEQSHQMLTWWTWKPQRSTHCPEARAITVAFQKSLSWPNPIIASKPLWIECWIGWTKSNSSSIRWISQWLLLLELVNLPHLSFSNQLQQLQKKAPVEKITPWVSGSISAHNRKIEAVWASKEAQLRLCLSKNRHRLPHLRYRQPQRFWPCQPAVLTNTN